MTRMSALTAERLPSPLLDRIQRPQDLHAMTNGELEALADEVRDELVRVVFETGGHRASNLGTVELTIALHSLLDSPTDKLVWDVGHQAYVHKLLTGRRDRFPTIRQHGGLTPFCERDESVHDVWGAGHASTSLSAALGMAVARDLQGDHHHVVAVIGDGGLTGGLALEASKRVKRSVKGMLMPSAFFEELGFDYIGPVDGHSIGEMRAALQTAMRLENRPVFIHAVTQKGHGYEPAEADPVKLHGVSPPGGSGGPPKYQDVFGAAVGELMR